MFFFDFLLTCTCHTLSWFQVCYIHDVTFANNINAHYTMISLETICPPIKLLQYYRSYSLCCILYLHGLFILKWEISTFDIPFTYCTLPPSGNNPFVLSTIHNSQDIAIGDIGVHKYVPQWILGYMNLFKCVFVYFG